MACFYCTSFDRHLFIVNEMLKCVIESTEALCTALKDKDTMSALVDATLIYNDMLDIQAYILKMKDSPESLSDGSDMTEELSDEDPFEVEVLPSSPVFQSASASSTLPRSDACSDLSSLSSLKKLKKVNEELAKKHEGTFIVKKQSDKKDNK